MGKDAFIGYHVLSNHMLYDAAFELFDELAVDNSVMRVERQGLKKIAVDFAAGAHNLHGVKIPQGGGAPRLGGLSRRDGARSSASPFSVASNKDRQSSLQSRMSMRSRSPKVTFASAAPATPLAVHPMSVSPAPSIGSVIDSSRGAAFSDSASHHRERSLARPSLVGVAPVARDLGGGPDRKPAFRRSNAAFFSPRRA